MTPNPADRLPVLTEVIEEDWMDGRHPAASVLPQAHTETGREAQAANMHMPLPPGHLNALVSQENAGPSQVFLTPKGGGPGIARSWGHSQENAGPSQVSLTPAGGGALPAEAIAELVQAQLDAALPRLQEWLRADLAQRLNHELEPRIHALLEIRLAMLARDLALELRPWVEELAQHAMASVLYEGLRN